MLLDSGPNSIPTLQTPAPSPDVLENPLFEPDTSSEIAEDGLIEERGSPSPSMVSFVEDMSTAEPASPPPCPHVLIRLISKTHKRWRRCAGNLSG